jgi:hypothetical protein
LAVGDNPSKTVRIERGSRVAEDLRGRNVWVGRVEEATGLELVSTTALEKILKDGDGKAEGEIRKLAEGGKEGLLARQAADGRYQIVGQEELAKIAGAGRVPERRGAAQNAAAPPPEDVVNKAPELSLVSTMMLRKVIGADGKAEVVAAAQEKPKAPRKSGRDKFGGFDPYNKS